MVLNSTVSTKEIYFRGLCVEWQCQSLEFMRRFSMQLDYQSSYAKKRKRENSLCFFLSRR